MVFNEITFMLAALTRHARTTLYSNVHIQNKFKRCGTEQFYVLSYLKRIHCYSSSFSYILLEHTAD